MHRQIKKSERSSGWQLKQWSGRGQSLDFGNLGVFKTLCRHLIKQLLYCTAVVSVCFDALDGCCATAPCTGIKQMNFFLSMYLITCLKIIF
jgi:hypothetical protein